MIISSNRKYNIGELKKGLWDGNWKWHPDMPYKIIGHTTRKEWIKNAENYEGRKLNDKEIKIGHISKYFYKISID